MREKIRLIDTHAHLTDRRFRRDQEEVILRARNSGLVAIVNVGYDVASSKDGLDLAQQRSWQGRIFPTVGVHPHNAESITGADWRELERLARLSQVVSVGEIGLDFYRDLSPRRVQREAFRRQIAIARDAGKPIIIHDRDAHNDVLRILRDEGASRCGGVLHCFSGDWHMAKACLDMGFYISIAGPVTYNNSGSLQDIAARIPLDRLMIETDCPYLAPQFKRGQRNEPAYVEEVAKKIAALRGIDLMEVAEHTTENAVDLFSLPLEGGQ